MCPVCEVWAFVSKTCSGNATCNHCPVCYSGAFFMLLRAPSHLSFMCCAHLGVTGVNNSHNHVQLFQMDSQHSQPFYSAQSSVWCFDFSLCLPACHGNSRKYLILQPPHPWKWTGLKKIDYFDLPSASAAGKVDFYAVV